MSQEGSVVPGVLSADPPSHPPARCSLTAALPSHHSCRAKATPRQPCPGTAAALPLPARSGCCRAAPSLLRRGCDAEGAAKTPLGAGSAASQGRHRRGLSAMTVHTSKRDRLGGDSARCPQAVAPPCPPPPAG